MELIDFLEQKGKEAELNSLRHYPDEDSVVRLSRFRHRSHQIDWIIWILSQVYEVEEKNGKPILKLKKSKKG